jgi:hypothetical protein
MHTHDIVLTFKCMVVFLYSLYIYILYDRIFICIYNQLVRRGKGMHIILGSSSRFRQQVLREAGVPFMVMTADIDEKAIRHPDPVTMVSSLATLTNMHLTIAHA